MPRKSTKNAKGDTAPAQKDQKKPSPTPVEVAEKLATQKTLEPVAPQESKYRKRVIHDNWAKYEELISIDQPEENETRNETDFSYLSEQVSSAASHFQMSSEKEWDKNTLKAEDIFQLDLKVLSAGLSCIPLNDIIGVRQEELTKNEKKKYDSFAQQSWLCYQPIYNNLKCKQDQLKVELKPVEAEGKCNDVKELGDNLVFETVDIKASNLSKSVKKEISPSSESLLPDVMPPELDITKEFCLDLSNVNISSVSKDKNSADDDNLEDWLDSVLND